MSVREGFSIGILADALGSYTERGDAAGEPSSKLQ